MHLADPDHRAPAGPTCVSPAPASRSRVPTILLVEDEAFVRDVACETLCSAGYRVLQARNAAEAVLAFRGHPDEVQLLLTDVVLPDRNGCDLALELVSMGRSVRAIFISGYPENSVTRKGLQHPGWSYLPKPFSAVSLLQKVREVLNEVSMRVRLNGGARILLCRAREKELGSSSLMPQELYSHPQRGFDLIFLGRAGL